MSALLIVTLYLYKDKQLLTIQNLRNSIHSQKSAVSFLTIM